MEKALLERAAQAIAQADALVIGAGAGMGVDSGLPDFRGSQGFWRAYPPYKKLGLSFSNLANPMWFKRDPTLAWGFYGHRQNLYRSTVPHEGFAILKRWSERIPTFAFTSNVDGQFQAAGFEPAAICEVHGSIHWVQCSAPCHDGIYAADDVKVEVDPDSFRAVGPLPTCERCGALLRPNILMFGDGGFVSDRSHKQERAYQAFLGRHAQGRVVVIEMGAGTAVPTVRWESERIQERGATLIRINPRESKGPEGTLSLKAGALEALQGILRQLGG